jgi:chemotaxis protein MotB
MENSGLRNGQIVEIRGFADRIPRIDNAPEDPRNRRVSIIVLNEESARRYRNT